MWNLFRDAIYQSTKTEITLPSITLKETSLFIPIERLVTLKHKGEEDKVDVANSFSHGVEKTPSLQKI